MLKQHDIEFVEYIKNCELTVGVLNDILGAYRLKYSEFINKLAILRKSPQTKFILKKTEEVNNELEFWITIVGYWTLKKLKEIFPEFNYELPREEPTLINQNINIKMKETILRNQIDIADLILANNDIGIIKAESEIFNHEINTGYRDIEETWLNPDLQIELNKLFREIDVKQKLVPGRTEVKYESLFDESIYVEKNINWPNYYDVQTLKFFIVGKDCTIKYYILLDAQIVENNDIQSLATLEKKRQENSPKRERINKKQ